MTKATHWGRRVLLVWSVLMWVCRADGALIRSQKQQTQLPHRQSLESSPFGGSWDAPSRTQSPSRSYPQNDGTAEARQGLDPRVLDYFDYRYPDGSYEYRFELNDGTARYERGYYLTFGQRRSLVVVGYYSYRMPTGRYITVFYNADHNGFRQSQSITRDSFPNLPRSIDVPQLKDEVLQNTTPLPGRIVATAPQRGPFH